MKINQIQINKKENVMDTLASITPTDYDLHFIFADKLEKFQK